MPELTARRVLVIGGAGFIGANLARALLHDGLDVHVMTRPATNTWRLDELVREITLHRQDLAQPGACDLIVALRPALIYDLAAPAGHLTAPGEEAAALAEQSAGVANQLATLRALPRTRLVHVCSSLEFAPSDRPHREDDVIRPTTARGRVRAAAALQLAAAAQVEGLRIALLRPFHVYGPWEQPDRLVPTVIRSVLQGAPVRLTAGNPRRDLVHVDDVVKAIRLTAAADFAPGETFNIGSGMEWSNREVVEAVAAACDAPLLVAAEPFPERPADVSHRVSDCSKARRLGWEPAHDLASGMAATVAWFREHMDLYPSL